MEPALNAPRVIGDIGGTNARFAIAQDGKYSQLKHVETEHYPSLHDALADYLNAQPHGELSGALAIAGPVLGDRISLTNKAWSFSIEDLKQSLNLATLTVVNDFAATAQAIPHLALQQKFAIGPAIANAHGNIGVVGPGTGFGMSSLIPHGGG
jgi:glucokinase